MRQSGEVMRQSCGGPHARGFLLARVSAGGISRVLCAPLGGDFLSSPPCIFNENLTHKFAILHFCHFTHRFAKLDAYLCKCIPRASTFSPSRTKRSVYCPVFLRRCNECHFAKLCFQSGALKGRELGEKSQFCHIRYKICFI